MGKNSRWAGLSASHEQAGLGGSCPFLQHRAASNNNGITALLTAQRPTSLPLPHSPCFFIILSFFSFSLGHINALMTSVCLSPATDRWEFSQARRLYCCFFPSDQKAYWLRRSAKPIHNKPFPKNSMPPLPLSPLKSPPLPGLSPLYIDSELQQLNGDIRRKYDEPRPLGSSLLDRLATVFRIATVSPTFPSPCLSVCSSSSPPRLSYSHSPHHRQIFH